MRLIDVEPLYKFYCELEKQARECQMDYLDHCKADSPNVIKWSAILTERTAYKHDLQDAPNIDAVPVVRCRDCKYYEGHYCKRVYIMVSDTDYCSRGKRRDSNDTDND